MKWSRLKTGVELILDDDVATTKSPGYLLFYRFSRWLPRPNWAWIQPPTEEAATDCPLLTPAPSWPEPEPLHGGMMVMFPDVIMTTVQKWSILTPTNSISPDCPHKWSRIINNNITDHHLSPCNTLKLSLFQCSAALLGWQRQLLQCTFIINAFEQS